MSAIWLRWVTLDSPLPPGWTPDSTVRYTAHILQEPEHTDSKTIIRHGQWKVIVDGFAGITPGESYSFVGRVTPRVILGKVSQITMVDPTFAKTKSSKYDSLSALEQLVVGLSGWRGTMVEQFQKSLPEPHASLAAGILLGVKGSMPYDFYQSLVATGTLHVVAASGFNVMIVASSLMTPLSFVLSRAWSVTIGLLGICVYVVLAGGSPSIVRAGIMGSLALFSYIWGRPTFAKRLLWITAFSMLLINPLLLVDIGFQLSVAATNGILYGEPSVRHWCEHGLKRVLFLDGKDRALLSHFKAYLAEYLYPTLAATLFTLPIILAWFGRISWISPIVNMLILPVVPLIMFLSAVAIAVAWVPIVGQIAIWILYVPLAYVIWIIRLFG